MSAKPPRHKLRVGERITLEPDCLVAGGEALGRLDGLPVFVPFAVPGDRLQARVISTKPDYARALITTVETPGTDRQDPPCPVFGQCGGCQWQMLGPAAQLRWKTRLVGEALQRTGGFGPDTLVAPCLPSPEIWHYRNKVHWAIAKPGTQWELGLYEARSHSVVMTSACAIQHPRLNAVQQALKEVLPMLDLSPYDERRGTGFLRSAFAKVGHRTGALMVGLVTREAAFPQGPALVAALRERLPDVHSIVQNVHPGVGNKLLGPRNLVLDGAEAIEETLAVSPERAPLRLSISPLAFFQVNGAAVEVLYDQVARACGLPPEPSAQRVPSLIVDAYSGTGAIAMFLAARGAPRVVGIEVVAEATRDAERGASNNGLTERCRFKTGKVEDLLAGVLAAAPGDTLVVLDPPRKGCEESVLQCLLQARPSVIVYVSCHPVTLARDLKRLAAGGYVLESVQPVDMFPQTAHVECVVRLRAVDAPV
ncbi:MAG: 23S rRNA (uracil(1939)-C(5))-methyltransferase RlmD [Candidatus Sericytochromatia bacterium]|nr:23S rRNA (uracil(1939)-C(5))-methyltransferase RlmD [Candidatus Sericytochromatia bacterium]